MLDEGNEQREKKEHTMKLLRPILLTQILFSVILFHMGHVFPLYAKPYIPDNDSVVLETLPTSGDPQIKKHRELRSQLSKSPNDLVLAVKLAREYLQIGRSKGDPRYDGYAEAALQPWWNLAYPPAEVLILRATLRQRRHDFDLALQDLSRIAQNHPNHPQAWLTQAVIHQVRGNYQEARRSCIPLLRLANTLVSTACIANTTGLNGQALDSYQSLQEAVRNAVSSTHQEKLWALTLLAEMASRLGKSLEAEKYFLEALAIDQEDTYLLGAYSDFLLDQDRPGEVQTLLENTPRSDGLLLRLALAEQQLNAPTLEGHIATLKARFAANRLRGESPHLREEARFRLHLLHQPQQALELAQKNWRIQREPWDARILLEAALQSKDPSAAQPVVDWLTSVGLKDVQLQKLTGFLS